MTRLNSVPAYGHLGIGTPDLQGFISIPHFDARILLRPDPAWPKISIVTPSLNQGEFLERTILSVLNQNYPNLEYLIIDGGSTDGSVEIIRKYEKYLAYWTSELDQGQSEAINKGFRKSTGTIMAWLNSDDAYYPQALLAVAEYFQRHPKADVIYGNAALIDGYDRLLREVRSVPFDLKAFLFSGVNLYSASLFWRERLWCNGERLNTELHFAMDLDLVLRFAEAGSEISHFRKCLAAFRVHTGSKSVNFRGGMAAEFSSMVARAAGVPHPSLRNSSHRFVYRLRKAYRLLRQGDADYVLRRAWSMIGELLRGL